MTVLQAGEANRTRFFCVILPIKTNLFLKSTPQESSSLLSDSVTVKWQVNLIHAGVETFQPFLIIIIACPSDVGKNTP
jgi:hypothetical protein